MKSSIATKLYSLGFAVVMTLGILGSLDALATTGQSREALLAQQATPHVACQSPDHKT